MLATDPAKVTFLTRRECSLCHEARAVIERVLPDFDVELEVIDVDGQEELTRLYGEQVPVVLLNGTKAFKFRVEEARLRRRLDSWRRRPSGRLEGA